MKKILVSIFVLALGEGYDLFIPIDINMRDALSLIQKSIQELSDGEYIIKPEDKILMYNEEGNMINTNNIVKFSGLKNGCKVMMI